LSSLKRDNALSFTLIVLMTLRLLLVLGHGRIGSIAWIPTYPLPFTGKFLDPDCGNNSDRHSRLKRRKLLLSWNILPQVVEISMIREPPLRTDIRVRRKTREELRYVVHAKQG
jgi:hypothetical protein